MKIHRNSLKFLVSSCHALALFCIVGIKMEIFGQSQQNKHHSEINRVPCTAEYKTRESCGKALWLATCLSFANSAFDLFLYKKKLL